MVNPDVGRLFAVVHIKGLQRKVTTEDVIIVMGDFPPTVGEKIRLEKVLVLKKRKGNVCCSMCLYFDNVRNKQKL